MDPAELGLAEEALLQLLQLESALFGPHSLKFPSQRSIENYSHSKSFARAQSYAKEIWQRWLSEYVPTFKKRVKWHALPEDSLETGDLVWLFESTSPRGHYPLARKKSLNYDKDNTARSANLRNVS